MWGLCGGPDVPHAALSVSTVNTESHGVGIKQSQLSVSSHIVQEDELLKAVRNSESLRLTFTLHLTESTSVEWETVVWRRCLYIRVPSCLLPEGSKEGFVSLLEYAEETLRCINIIICLRKDRADRAMLVRTSCFWASVFYRRLTPWYHQAVMLAISTCSMPSSSQPEAQLLFQI